MNASFILTAVPWAGCAACAGVAVSGYVRMARTKGGWRDPGLQFGPLVFTSAAMAALTYAAASGTAGMLGGSLLALILLTPVASRVTWAWREAAARLGKGRATRLILSLIWGRLRDALWNAREDVRDLLGLVRRDSEPDAKATPAPLRATPGVPPWKRAVPGIPPVASDPALGPAPAASEVAAALAAGGVMVPPAWEAVASEAADHDPDTEDEHVEHMDGEIAGLLTFGEAAISRAETLGDRTGLDPAYVSAQYELADVYADAAAQAAQVMKRYHGHYDDLGEAAGDVPLPKNPHWFNGGGASPAGGRAA
jgi:hypothetical protein